MSLAPSPSRARTLRELMPLGSEIPKLIILVALTTATFIGTRAVAGRERSQQLLDARMWHERGRDAVAHSDPERATAAFRRAAAKDRANRAYAIDLARALADDGQLDAAARVLTALRDSAPEDPETNLQLARVTARRGDAAEAVRYYRSALYAPWPDLRRRLDVRLELSEFLLDQHQPERALPELIAAVADPPDDPDIGVKLGDLLRHAGDARRALEVFRSILMRDRNDPRALAGAGMAAFDLGQYATALRYLRAAPDDPGISEQRSLAAMVIARDPLAIGLGPMERRRRAADNLATVAGHLQVCVAQHGTGVAADAMMALIAALAGASGKRQSADRDVLEDGLAVIGRGEQLLASYCAIDLTDRALGMVIAMHADLP